ncbi:uncharacterized protein LOC144107518 [Amblyomma americanum]|uniref:WAP domain-containing protein n=1 Tax=Amblyomma americanum TaxID=6943 RepID=A0AAQ4EZW8_AMBAM
MLPPLLLLGVEALLAATAFAPAAVAHNTFVCLPKPVKFDTCTSIRLLSPCQSDQDCDTRVCCKDWCGNYCAFKQRSFAVDAKPPADPADDDEDDGSEEEQRPAPPARGSRRIDRGSRRDQDEDQEEPQRHKNSRRRRSGRRRRRMDAAGSDALMRSNREDEPDSSGGAAGQPEHEYFDVRK